MHAPMSAPSRKLLSGNEAVAHAALAAGVRFASAYPGTPSTEILEHFSAIGGRAEWAPNEKVALEVGIGAAYARARVLVTMKHVGVNVAADPLFTAAYTGVDGALVLVSADDPGMASSQNEQDNRWYALHAGVPMLEPSSSQEAYDLFGLAIEMSERWGTPVLFRMTTRICHSKTVVELRDLPQTDRAVGFERDIHRRVMVPAFARPAHRKLRETLKAVAAWNESEGPNRIHEPAEGGRATLGIITGGITTQHVREAAPEARVLQLGCAHPLPVETIRDFAAGVDTCVVVEEGDPYLETLIRAAGIDVRGKPEMYRFGELTVGRVRRILGGDTSEEAAPPKGKPPQLCPGCPHRTAFEFLGSEKCIVTGDIGCYTLGVLPPFSAMDTCVCMGASIGVGLGLRHALPEDEARRVVSVIGDSTFMHSGLTGLVEMVYNRPPTGHVVLVLDNRTTAMTGLQEHPGTGRDLAHQPAPEVDIAAVARGIGVENVVEIDLKQKDHGLEDTLTRALASGETWLIVARRECILAAKHIRRYEETAKEDCGGE
jgi:indolepyruvate ferredoxin oxidoreductase alpha subunit